MAYSTKRIAEIADSLVRKCGASSPEAIAEFLDIPVKSCAFTNQLGAFKIIAGYPFIFIKNDLDEHFRKIVIYHECGHAVLHFDIAEKLGILQDFSLYNMRSDRMEYEANVFAAHIALPTEDILRNIKDGYDIQQIAAMMDSDTNLVALKCSLLNSMGYDFRPQEYTQKFLSATCPKK